MAYHWAYHRATKHWAQPSPDVFLRDYDVDGDDDEEEESADVLDNEECEAVRDVDLRHQHVQSVGGKVGEYETKQEEWGRFLCRTLHLPAKVEWSHTQEQGRPEHRGADEGSGQGDVVQEVIDTSLDAAHGQFLLSGFSYDHDLLSEPCVYFF